MLERIHLKNVGPAPEMEMNLAERLNLITGDNGLGKTLLLDGAWWALTRTWPLTWGGKGIVPEKEGAAIAWTEDGLTTEVSYDFSNARWGGAPIKPGDTFLADTPENERAAEERHMQRALVLYLRVDGGVSVYDPLRLGEAFRAATGQAPYGGSHVYQFRERDIWDGLALADGGKLVTEGLVRDVGRWAGQPSNADFDQLATLIEKLAGEEQFRLVRKVQRVYVDDPRDFPVVAGPVGEIPLAHAPAGLRRIFGLAYLAVWAWREHKLAASLKRRSPNTSLVVLIDEIEAHLHPKWQRTILPSLLRALNDEVQLQVIATTHSPMVLASVESVFDLARDAWFDLDLEQGQAVLRKRPYIRHGEIGNWLVSDAFDLREPRSLEGEKAVAAAEALMHMEAPSREALIAADRALREAGLPDIDKFWVRWRYFRDRNLKPDASGETLA